MTLTQDQIREASAGVFLILVLSLCSCAKSPAEIAADETLASIDMRLEEMKKPCLEYGKPRRTRVYLQRRFQYLTISPCLKRGELPKVGQ